MSVPLIPANSVWKIDIAGLYQGSYCYNIFHVLNKIPVATAGVIAQQARDELMREMLAPMHSEQVEYKLVMATLVEVGIIIQDVIIPTGERGARGVIGLPPMVSQIMRFRTNDPSRNGRGRVYMYGIPSNWFSGENRLNPAGLEQYLLFRDQWQSKYKVGGNSSYFTMGVFSRKVFHSTGDATAAFSGLTHCEVNLRFTSMAHRRD